jgi:hypothetical protein
MSINYNFYNDPKNEEYDYLRNTNYFINQPYNPYFEQNINPFSKSQNTRKLTKNLNENMTQFSNINNNRRNTVSVIPFPTDSPFNEENTNNSNIIPPELKIKKVTKIRTNNRNNLNNNFQNKYNQYKKESKFQKEVVSENMPKIKKNPIDDYSGNSSDNKNIKSKSDNVSENNNGNKSKKNINNKNNNAHNGINKNINKNLIKNQNNNIKNNTNNKKQNNYNQNNLPENEKLKNQFINRNLTVFAMLKRNKILINLEKICQNRMQLFEKDFQNDICFKKKDFFNNVFINKGEIGKNFPLTLIFHYLLNPKIAVNHFSFQKNFYENVLLLHEFKNIKVSYDENMLNKVPKFFDDLNYVNNMFQNFELSELNKFINEIKNWPKTFDLEIEYEDINNNKIKDQVKIYFISPKDITVEYNSNSANSSKSFAEFNFHCDIDYDKNKGRFVFNTIANVYNKCEELYQFEFLGEIWERAMIAIKEECQKNKINMDKIFKEHLKKNLHKYSSSINYIIKDIIDKDKKENINYEKIGDKKDLKIINKNFFNEMNKEDKIINKEKETKVNKKIGNEQNNEIMNKNEKKTFNLIINNTDKAKEQILHYGVMLSFFIFIFKTVLSIELGTFSLETFFNFLIIIIIGFMLVKNKSSI